MRKPYLDWTALVVLSFFCSWLAGCGGGDSTSPPVCGDGVVDTGEQCDDGNTKSGDGCSVTCQTESAAATCGDGHVDPGEQCDDGNTEERRRLLRRPARPRAPRPSAATAPSTAGEQCDDGNTKSGDGCSSTCQKESAAASAATATSIRASSATTATPRRRRLLLHLPDRAGANEVICQTLEPAPERHVRGDRGRRRAAHRGHRAHADHPLPRRAGLVDATGIIVQVGCRRLRRRPDLRGGGGDGDDDHLPEGVVSPGPHQHARPHHVHARPARPPTRASATSTATSGARASTATPRSPSPGGATADQISWGELRFLFGGATSTVGSGGETGLLRNLDKANLRGGPRQAGGRLRHVPARRLVAAERVPRRGACSAFTGIVSDTDATFTAADALRAARRRGHRRATRPTSSSASASRTPGTTSCVAKSAFIHAVGLTAAQYARHGQERHGAHLVAALERLALRQHGAGHRGRAPRHHHRARHRLAALAAR